MTKAETALCNGLSVLNGMPRTNYQDMVDEGFIKSALSEGAQCCGVKYELKTVANYYDCMEAQEPYYEGPPYACGGTTGL